MKDSQNGGFTLIEVLIASLVSLPILAAIVSTSKVVGSSLQTNVRASDVSEALEATAQRIERLIRPTALSTVEVKATQADVAAIKTVEDLKVLANQNYVPIVPAVGEWIGPTDLQPRPTLRFRSARGVLSMNASSLTTPMELEFVMDSNELDNDIDDDGDGMVDEGGLFLTDNTNRIALASGVESCSFTLDGSVVRFSIQLARRDASKHIHRASVERKFHMRNN